MAHEIVWSEPAQQDLEEIEQYIARDSLIYAAKAIQEVFRVVNLLADFPRMGRHVPERDEDALREVIVYQYRVIYRVESSTVTILTILHGARLFPPELLR